MKYRVYGFPFVFKIGCPSEPVNVRSKYFTSEVAGIMLLLNETGGQSPGLSKKVIKDDLESFIFIFHCSDQT